MVIEEIKLDKNTSIYKSKIQLECIDKLLSDIKLNVDISSDTTYPTENNPGIQSTLIISSIEIQTTLNSIKNVLFNFLNLADNTVYFLKNWIYISENKNKYIGWHEHTKSNYSGIKVYPKWTYTLYLQMPDNLIGNDGKLAFKLNDGTIHMVLPKVNDLFIFPATLLHTPISNINSTKERIVLAGIFCDIDTTANLVKKEKTLF